MFLCCFFLFSFFFFFIFLFIFYFLFPERYFFLSHLRKLIAKEPPSPCSKNKKERKKKVRWFRIYKATGEIWKERERKIIEKSYSKETGRVYFDALKFCFWTACRSWHGYGKNWKTNNAGCSSCWINPTCYWNISKLRNW